MRYETRYFVDEEAKTVACVIECSSFDALNYVENNDCYEYSSFKSHIAREALMPTRFTGVARCSDKDTFDGHIGRLLAFNRAKGKYDNAFRKRVTYLIRKASESNYQTLRRLTQYDMKADYHQDRRNREINEYLSK